MDCEQGKKPVITLVYYDFRGFGQLIRSLLYYMNAQFKEILINKGQSFKSKNYGVNISEVESLPFIIDGEIVIHNNSSIIFYICKKFGHQALLGQTIYERAKIKQIFGKFIDKYSLKMKVLYSFLEKVIKCPNNILQLKRQALKDIRNVSSNVDPLYKYALARNDSKYLLGHITLLDFLFYESCFYVTNCFSDIQQEPCKIKTLFNSILGTQFGKQESDLAQFIKVLKQYKNMFEAQSFYSINKEKLESYGVCCPNFDKQISEAYKKIWIGPKHFFH